MIQFRQKEFIAPLVAGIGKALTTAGQGSKLLGALNMGGQAAGIAQIPMGIKQSNDAAKQQEEALRQQNLDSKRQAKAINNLANATAQAAKANPGMSSTIASNNGQAMGKLFSGHQNFRAKWNNVKQVAGDMWKVGNKDRAINKRVAGTIASGVTAAGLAYGVNKIIAHDARKHGLMAEQTKEQKEEAKETRKKNLKKAAIGTLATAGTVALGTMAAKKGLLGNSAQKFANTKLTRANIKNQSRLVASELGEGFKGQFNNPVGAAMTIGLGAGIPLAQYASARLQQRAQEKQSEGETQREYSAKVVNNNNWLMRTLNSGKEMVKSAAKTGKNEFKFFLKKPGQSILGGISNWRGGGGREGVSRFTSELKKQGNSSGHNATVKVANWLDNHKKTALAGSIGIGVALAKPWAIGNKLGMKAAETIDTDAYAYDKANRQMIE